MTVTRRDELPGQGQLFDMPADKPRQVEHPGQLPFVDWMKRSFTEFHGSHRADWEKTYAHMGTQAAASDRLVQVAANTSPGREPTDMPAGGRLWARRQTEPVAAVTLSDSRANVALRTVQRDPEKLYAGRETEIPGYQSSESEEIKSLGRHIREGRPIGYQNAYEDQGQMSTVAPPGTLRAWHQDVNEAVSMGLDVHPHDIALAKQQFDPEITVTPKSMTSAAERWTRNDEPFNAGQQESLLPYRVVPPVPELGPGEYGPLEPEKEGTYFGVHPEDTNRDNWGSPTPYPKGAWERAHAAMEENYGSKVAATNPYSSTPFPEGVARVPRRMKSH